MAARIVHVTLNQQQMELVDRTLATGIASDRAALLTLALRRYAVRHLPRQDAGTPSNQRAG